MRPTSIRLKHDAAGLPIEFPGFVNVPEFFDTIDMVILPSWEEPFGIVLLEAMAAGIPIIATNCGGPAEIARGVLIPPRDPLALAHAIKSLRPRDLVDDARKHVEERFDIRKIVPRIEEFYMAV
jgi:glycosyltransferase involved in cell wall biosynthesis